MTSFPPSSRRGRSGNSEPRSSCPGSKDSGHAERRARQPHRPAVPRLADPRLRRHQRSAGVLRKRRDRNGLEPATRVPFRRPRLRGHRSADLRKGRQRTPALSGVALHAESTDGKFVFSPRECSKWPAPARRSHALTASDRLTPCAHEPALDRGPSPTGSRTALHGVRSNLPREPSQTAASASPLGFATARIEKAPACAA
jgi:hypothetical protein